MQPKAIIPQAIALCAPIWADERVWCKFARSNDIRSALACPNLKAGAGPCYCSLNGFTAQSPCVFNEPPDAPVWTEIRESVVEYRAKGWPV